MPSVPEFPRPREQASRPASRPEYESFETGESFTLTLAASTAFQEVATFGGRPESITIDASAGGIDIRFRQRGSAGFGTFRTQGAGERRFQVAAEIVEARDPAGVGTQIVTAVGRFASRQIDVRNTFGGPSRERPLLPVEALADQVDPPQY